MSKAIDALREAIPKPDDVDETKIPRLSFRKETLLDGDNDGLGDAVSSAGPTDHDAVAWPDKLRRA
jgi:hypothetical protein